MCVCVLIHATQWGLEYTLVKQGLFGKQRHFGWSSEFPSTVFGLRRGFKVPVTFGFSLMVQVRLQFRLGSVFHQRALTSLRVALL